MENNKILTDGTEKLKQYLVTLNRAKGELNEIRTQLEGILHNIDEDLAKVTTNWTEHREKYYNDLTEQLKKQPQPGIDLSVEEQAILRECTSTATSVADARKKLDDLNLKNKVPNDATDFTVAACSAVSAAQSRMLKPNDPYSVVKALNIIPGEKKDADKFKAQHKEQLTKVMKDVNELQKKVSAIVGISTKEQEEIKQMASDIIKRKKAEEAAAAAPAMDMDQTGG